jgi:hypothetical protein
MMSREEAREEPYAERIIQQFSPFLQKLPKRMAATPAP